MSFWKGLAEGFLSACSDEEQEKLKEYAYAVEVAKADPIEALHGHYCGPGCMHVDLLSADEREALRKRRGWEEWPSVVMARYATEKKK